MVRASKVKKGGSRNASRGEHRLTTPESGRGRKEKDAMSSLLMLSDTDEVGAQPESMFDRLKTPPNPPGLNNVKPRNSSGFSPLQDIPYSRSELVRQARNRGISAEGYFRDVRPTDISRRPPRPPSILEGTKSQDIVSAPLIEEEEEEISFRDFGPVEHTAVKVASGDKRGASVFPSIAKETYQKPKPNEALAQESQISISIPAPLANAKHVRKGLAIARNAARPAPIDTRGSSTILDGGQMLSLQPSTTSVGREESRASLSSSPPKASHYTRSSQRERGVESPLPPIEHLTGTRLHFVEKEENDLHNRPPSVQESAAKVASLISVAPPSPVYVTRKTFVVDPNYLEKTKTLTLDSSLLDRAALASDALRNTDALESSKPPGAVLSPSKSTLRSPVALKARSPQRAKGGHETNQSVAVTAGNVVFDAPVPAEQVYNPNTTNQMPSTFGSKKPPAEPEIIGTGIEIAAEVFDEEEDYDSDGSNPEDRGLRQLIAKHSENRRIKRPKPRRVRGRKGHIMTSQFPRAGVSTSVMDPYVRTLNNKKKQFEEKTFVAEIKNLREVMAQAQKFREENRKLKLTRKSSSAVTGMQALGPEGVGMRSVSPDEGFKYAYDSEAKQEMEEVYEQHVTFPMTPQ